MKLRIVTATRGGSPYWNEMIASIRGAPEAEHVIVCPVGEMAAVAASAPKARVVVETGTGLYAALSQGWREPGDWEAFTWLNDDDRFSSPGFRRLIDRLRKRPDIDVAYGCVELIDGRGARLGALPVARRGSDLGALLARGVIPLAQPGTVIRRRIGEQIGGFDASYNLAGDLDFFVRALVAGAKFEFVGAAVAAFRLTAGQLSKSRGQREAETARALAPLAGAKRSTAALWRFRFDNLPLYFERVRRHGWVSMEDLYERIK